MKELFPENSILVANKTENNLKDLLLRSNLYQRDLLDNTKHGCKSCKKNVSLSITLWIKQQPSNILLLEEYLKSQEIVHVKRKM